MPRAKYVNIADGVSRTEAAELGRRLAVDFERIPMAEWQAGIAHEREHNAVLKGDPLKTAMTALDHLKEHPDYYSKLKKMEKEAAAMVEEKPYPGSPEHKKMMMRESGRKSGMKKAAASERTERIREQRRRNKRMARGAGIGAAAGLVLPDAINRYYRYIGTPSYGMTTAAGAGLGALGGLAYHGARERRRKKDGMKKSAGPVMKRLKRRAATGAAIGTGLGYGLYRHAGLHGADVGFVIPAGTAFGALGGTAYHELRERGRRKRDREERRRKREARKQQ